MNKTSLIYQYRTNDKTKQSDERHEQIAPTRSAATRQAIRGRKKSAVNRNGTRRSQED